MITAELRPEQDRTIVFLHGMNIGSWMWRPQTESLTEFHTLCPSLPGFGEDTGARWISLTDAAAQVAELIRARAHDGTADVVGLSFGGTVTLRLIADHPHVVRSAVISGANAAPASRMLRAANRAQLAVWDRPFFWKGQARAFALPEEDRDLFIRGGLAITRENAAAAVADSFAAGVPDGLAASGVPVLAAVGGAEQGQMKKSLRLIADAGPNIVPVVAPGLHHAWSAEDPELFTRMVRSWIADHSVAAGLERLS